MAKRRKFKLAGIAVLVAVLVAGLGGYALAQSGGNTQTATQAAGAVHSRHIDYNVSLQVNGDLSAVNPKLKGLLPLNLTAQGGADVEKTAAGVSASGDVKLGGLDQIISSVATGNGSGGSSALGGLVSGALSDVQFVEVNKELYVKLAGSWYDVGNPAACRKGEKAGPAGAGAGHPELKGAFPGGAKSLLKDVKTVGQEDIDGVSTTHYSGSIDIDKAVTDAETALRSAGKTGQADRLEAARGQIDAAAKQLDLDWWIDASGNLRQAKVAVEIDPSGLASLVNAKGGRGDKLSAALKGISSVKLDATIKLSHFDEDFQIAKPDGNILPLKSLPGLSGLAAHRRGNHNWHKNGNTGTTPAA